MAEVTTITLPGRVELKMVAIPEGSFPMGSPADNIGFYYNEGPQHQVTLNSFLMGKYPITQAQWRAVATLPEIEISLDPDPSAFKGDNRPVEQVNWHEALEFCYRLSTYTGTVYTLPSEAQWEYACRAGTTTAFHFGETISTNQANYNGSYIYANGHKGVWREETTEVGMFPANAFGLHDMHGNVYEWCLDNYEISYRGAPTDGSAWKRKKSPWEIRHILRGGSWVDGPWYCRSAQRGFLKEFVSDSYIGFRVVCLLK